MIRYPYKKQVLKQRLLLLYASFIKGTLIFWKKNFLKNLLFNIHNCSYLKQLFWKKFHWFFLPCKILIIDTGDFVYHMYILYVHKSIILLEEWHFNSSIGINLCHVYLIWSLLNEISIQFNRISDYVHKGLFCNQTKIHNDYKN